MEPDAPQRVTTLYHDSCHHRVYGLTCDAFDDVWLYAEGCCQICGKLEVETGRGRLVIDHLQGGYGMHVVRGLLCDACNLLLGRIENGKHRGRVATEVYTYRMNSWFARQLDPRGASVRYAAPGLKSVAPLRLLIGVPDLRSERESRPLPAKYEFAGNRSIAPQLDPDHAQLGVVGVQCGPHLARCVAPCVTPFLSGLSGTVVHDESA